MTRADRPAPPYPGVGAVVVHHRREAALAATVAALAELLPPERIVVVDNSATLDAATLAVRVVVPGANVGYGAGVNLGVRALGGDALTVLVATHETAIDAPALTAMLEMLREGRVGQVGPVLVDRGRGPHAVWSAGGRYTPVLAHPRHRRSVGERSRVRWVDGSCFLVTRALFEKVGGLAEHFFLYGEDVAFSRAVRRAGYDVAVCPTAWVGRGHKGPDLRLAVRNRWLLLRDHFPARVAVVGIGQLHLKAAALAVLPTAFHRGRARQYRAGMAEARAIRSEVRQRGM